MTQLVWPHASVSDTDPQKRVQSSVLHELSEDHDWTAGSDDALEVDDVGMVELAHDGRLRQEIPPLFVRVSSFESLNGDVVFFFSWDLQSAATHLAKLACSAHTHTLTCFSTTL